MNTEQISDGGPAEIPDDLELCVWFLSKLGQTKDQSKEGITGMAQKAMQIGFAQAESFVGKRMEEQAEKDGIRLEMQAGGIAVNKLLRAQYDSKKRVIVTYQDGVNSALETQGPELLGCEHSVEAVREVFMWHEYFHYIEFSSLGLLGEKMRLQKKILFFSVSRPFYAISEVAANAFSQRVLQLKHNPFLLDYLLIKQTGDDKSLEVSGV